MSAARAHRLQFWCLASILILAIVIPYLLLKNTGAPLGKVAIPVGVVHLLILVLAQWWQARVRSRLLADIRLVLGTQISTQLTLIQTAALLPEESGRLQAIQTASGTIAQSLKNLSTESLTSWHHLHDEALRAAQAHGLELGRR